MMKQVYEEPVQQSPASAAVTPGEFAEAVADIENRKAGPDDLFNNTDLPWKAEGIK